MVAKQAHFSVAIVHHAESLTRLLPPQARIVSDLARGLLGDDER
jgi:hypothetical protein